MTVAATEGELANVMTEKNPDKMATNATQAKDLRVFEIRIIRGHFLTFNVLNNEHRKSIYALSTLASDDGIGGENLCQHSLTLISGVISIIR